MDDSLWEISGYVWKQELGTTASVLNLQLAIRCKLAVFHPFFTTKMALSWSHGLQYGSSMAHLHPFDVLFIVRNQMARFANTIMAQQLPS